jgi:hypothetical protein
MAGNYEPTDDHNLAARNLAADMLTREALTSWLGQYPVLPVAEPRNVLVIMAGNIPFVGLHDLLCVLAAGHRAVVKPSSRDAANMTWVVDQLLGIDPTLPVSIHPMDVRDDSRGPIPTFNSVVAMGSDDTVRAIAGQWAGIPMLLRGSRSSLAVVDGTETPDELNGLADDVLMFSGLGCRNVSLIFVPRGYDFSALRGVLSARVDGLDRRFVNNLRHQRALLALSGVEFIDCGAALLTEGREFSSAPSVVHYSFYDSANEVNEWIAAHEGGIQCVALNRLASQVAVCPLGEGWGQTERTVIFGRTQRPGLLDYPDGIDTMKFLEKI